MTYVAFFDALCLITERGRDGSHCFDFPTGQVWVGFIKQVKVGGALYLSSFLCTNPRMGYGTEAMNRLCELADSYGVSLRLHPESFGPHFTPQHVLEIFYAGFGFQNSGDMGWIRRPVYHNYFQQKGKSHELHR